MKKTGLIAVALIALLASCDPILDDADVSRYATSVSAEELKAGFTYTQYEDEEYAEEASDGNYFVFSTDPELIVTIYQLDEETGEQTILSSGTSNGTFILSPARNSDNNQTIYVSALGEDGELITCSIEVTVYVLSELTEQMIMLTTDHVGYKKWIWDTTWRDDGGAWGNAGYAAGGDGNWSGGIWWACAPADLLEQSAHSGGATTGEESESAYMLLRETSRIETYDADGNKIRTSKTLSFSNYSGSRDQTSSDGSCENYSYGNLSTDAGSILWPYQINAGGVEVGDFEIVDISSDELRLVYPIAASTGTAGSWSECTWWAFRPAGPDPDEYLSDNYSTKVWKWDTEFRSDGIVWGNGGYSAGTGYDGAWSGGIWWGATPADLADQLGHSVTGEATGEEDADAYMIIDGTNYTISSYTADGTLIRSGGYSYSDWAFDQTMSSSDGQSNWAYGKLVTDSPAILFPFSINEGGVYANEFEVVSFTDETLQLVYDKGSGNWGECTWWAFRAEDAFGSTSSDSDTSTDSDGGTTDDDTVTDDTTTDDTTTDSDSGLAEEDGSGSSEE